MNKLDELYTAVVQQCEQNGIDLKKRCHDVLFDLNDNIYELMLILLVLSCVNIAYWYLFIWFSPNVELGFAAGIIVLGLLFIAGTTEDSKGLGWFSAVVLFICLSPMILMIILVTKIVNMMIQRPRKIELVKQTGIEDIGLIYHLYERHRRSSIERIKTEWKVVSVAIGLMELRERRNAGLERLCIDIEYIVNDYLERQEPIYDVTSSDFSYLDCYASACFSKGRSKADEAKDKDIIEQNREAIRLYINDLLGIDIEQNHNVATSESSATIEPFHDMGIGAAMDNALQMAQRVVRSLPLHY